MLTARDVADALFMLTSATIVAAVENGSIHAVRVGKQYRIARAEAARWIRNLEASK